MIPLISLSRALCDVNLLGAPFQVPSFWPWKTLAKVIDGEPLREQRESNCSDQATGRATTDRAGGEVDVLLGRRGGTNRL